MKATIVTSAATFEVEAENCLHAFDSIAEVHEIFGETKCGLCGSPSFRFLRRTSGQYTFRELECTDCHAKLQFVLTQNGAFFASRKLLPNGKPDKAGAFGTHNGWTKYRGESY